jgi:Flp pilus assembly protein protease CpaA
MHRRSSPIRIAAVHSVVNLQLSVCQTDIRSLFLVNRLSFSFCVSIVFTSAAPRHFSLCLYFYRTSLDQDLVTFSVSKILLTQRPDLYM